MTEEKVIENRVRRMAERQGLKLEKSRRRDPRAIGFGGFQLVDQNNVVVCGGAPHEYSATIADVEAYLAGR